MGETGKTIGLDFGIKDNIIDNDGNTYNWTYPETKRLREVSCKMNKSYSHGKKRTKNHAKCSQVIALEYEKLGNKKRDARNKFVAKLWEENDVIAVQDENIAEWKSSRMKGWGQRIQHTIMGGIMSGIRKLPQTVIVDKWFASTQICPQCGNKQKRSLADRTYTCACGYSGDRDAKAAQCILQEALRIRPGRMKQMPAEIETSGLLELALSV